MECRRIRSVSVIYTSGLIWCNLLLQFSSGYAAQVSFVYYFHNKQLAIVLFPTVPSWNELTYFSFFLRLLFLFGSRPLCKVFSLFSLVNMFLSDLLFTRFCCAKISSFFKEPHYFLCINLCKLLQFFKLVVKNKV